MTEFEFEDEPMRFQHAIDILLAEERKLRFRNFSDEPLEDTDAECEAKIADIEDTLNNLYAIREACPHRDK